MLMRKNNNRALGIIVAFALVMSCCVPAFMLTGVSAEKSTFTPESYHIGFESYTPTEGDYWNEPTSWAYSTDGSITWSTADGVLKYAKDASGNNWNCIWNDYAFYNIMKLNETGANLNSDTGTIKLTPGAIYNVNVRLNLNIINKNANEDIGLYLGVGASDKLSDNVTMADGNWTCTINGGMLLDRFTYSTDGWVDKTYKITVPEDSGEGGLLLGITPISNTGDGSTFSSYTYSCFEILIDDVQIDRCAKVNIHAIEASGKDNVSVYYGIPGTYVNPDDSYEYTYYENYNPDAAEKFSNPIIPDTDKNGYYKFTNQTETDIYYLKDHVIEESYHIGFESYTPTEGDYWNEPTSWAYSTDGSITWSTADGVLKYAKDASGNNWNCIWNDYAFYNIMKLNETGANLNSDAETIKLTPGAYYTVSVRYKLDIINLNENEDIGLYLGVGTSDKLSDNVTMADGNWTCSINDGILLARFSESTDGWINKTYNVIVPEDAGEGGLLLGITPIAKTSDGSDFSSYTYSCFELLIDDVNIDRVASFEPAEKSAVIFHTNTSDTEDITTKTEGGIGTEVDDPMLIPEKYGYDFEGWYSDKELKNKVKTVYYPVEKNTELHLYARWIPRGIDEYDYITDFENSPFTAEKTGQFNSDFFSVIDSGNIFAGDKSLKYNAVKGTAGYSNQYSSFIVYNGKNKQGIKLKNSTSYVMHFWYKAEKLERSVRVTPMTNYWDSNGGNYYVSDVQTASYDASAYVISKSEVGDDWKQGVIYFTTGDDIERNDWWGYNMLFMRVNTLSDSNAVVYFDNITVTETDSSVAFENYDYISDFEDTPYSQATGSIINSDYFNVVKSGAKYEDDYAVKYTHKKGDTPQFVSYSSFELYNRDNKEGIRLSDNTDYKVTFRYKADSLPVDVRVEAMSGFWDNNGGNYFVLDDTEVYSGNGYTISASQADGSWKTGVLYFSTGDLTDDPYWGYNMLYLCVNAVKDENVTVYFDDITLSVLSKDTIYISEVYTAEKNVFITTVSENGVLRPIKNGDVLELGVPYTPGYRFLGWYEDSKYTKQINDGKYTVNGSANVYAKWSLSYASVDFEGYPKTVTDNNLRFSAGINIANGFGYNSSSSLRYSYNPDITNNWGYAQLLNKNDIVDLREDPLVIEKGRSYKVTFKYLSKNIKNSVFVSVVTASRTNCWGWQTDNCSSVKITPSDNGKGWKTAEFVFTADPQIDPSGSEDCDALYLKLAALGNYADIYIDDFELTSLGDDVYIEYEANNGYNRTFIVGTPGNNIGSPIIPQREGFTFEGWYTDVELKNKYTATKFGNSSITLYAKWNMNDTVKISFEEDYYRDQLQRFQTDCARVSDAMASDGKYSMEIDKTKKFQNRSNAAMMLRIGNTPFKVENNQTYVLTFDYYVVSAGNNTDSATTPNPGVMIAQEENMWAYTTWPEGSWTLPLPEERGKWKTASFMFTANLENEDMNTLYFRVYSTEGFHGYFDNIRISKVDRSSKQVAINLNPCGATNLNGTKQLYQGNYQDTIMLPTNLTRSGWLFTGWYTDQKCTSQVENNMYTFGKVDQTLYAGWAIESFIQGFENFHDIEPERYYYMDFDYEIVKDSANAHSGSYYLRRKGDDYHFATAQIMDINLGAYLAISKVYKMTMYIKLGESKQTDGAVSFGCTDNIKYGWGIDGDWKNIVAIEDLSDKQWHKVEFTFLATGKYISINTPGYVELYIDDISFELLPNATAEDCSKSVACKEYIPKRIDKDGELAITDKAIDVSLLKMVGGGEISSNGKNILIIACVALIVIIGASVSIIFIIKHRKNRGGI